MNILILPGDGVGKEVTDQSVKIIEEISSIYSIDIDISFAEFGGTAYDSSGDPYPKSTKEAVNKCDAILLGAVGGHKYENLEKSKTPEYALLSLRKENDLYINLRPIISFDEILDSSTLKRDYINDLNLIIVRELVEGLYFGEPRGFNKDKTEAFNTMRYSKERIKKILKFAYNLSEVRAKKLCSVDKANVLECSKLWREIANNYAKDFPSIKSENMYVDNAAMQLVLNPKQFDVIVTENLFGDILSDLASVLTGSIGMLPSASINDSGFGLYEPIHGSAPDIAGKDIVNPIATILSAAMMFHYSFKREDIYNLIVECIRDTLKDGYRTRDIMSNGMTEVSTSEMGNMVLEKIKDKNLG